MKYKKGYKIVAVSILSAFLLATNVYGDNLTSTLIDGKEFFYGKNSITLIVNDKVIDNLPMEPIIYKEFVLVPVKEVLEQFDVYIEYSKDTRLCSLVRGDDIVRFYVDNLVAQVNNESKFMSIEAKIINDKLMVPLRFISESLGLNIDWNPITRTVFVNDYSEKVAPDEIIIEEEIIPEGTTIDNGNEKTEFIDEDKDDIINSTIIDSSDEVLGYMPADVTSISKVTTSSEGIIIDFTNPLSYVEKSILSDNRLLLDINSCGLGNQGEALEINDSNIYRVRFGSDEEKNVSRVVLDLKDNISFRVTYKEDRKSIYISFEESVINNVNLVTNNNNDTLEFQYSKKVSPKIEFFGNPNRVVIYFPNTKIEKNIDQEEKGKFITHIRTTEEENNTIKAVIYLNSQVQLKTSSDDERYFIEFLPPTTKNIEYDYDNRQLVLKKNSTDKIDLDHLLHKDDYLNLNYEIDFNQDLLQSYGYGKFHIGDDYINNIEFINEGTTKIIVDEKQVVITKLDEDNENYYIKFRTAKEEYPLVVVLDAGHGGHDGGAGGNGVQEKYLNTDVVERLYSLIKEDDIIKAYLTKEGDTFISLGERARRGNRMGDVFVSIHSNSSNNSTPHGSEIYYYKHSNDAQIGFYSSEFAKILNESLVSLIGSFDRGVKTNSFVVIKDTKIPAILVEMGFVSNHYEAGLLATESYRQKIAEGLYEGLLKTMEVYKPR